MLEQEHPLTRFYQALGHQAHSALGVLWIDVGQFSMTCVPCSSLITATGPEVEQVLRQSGRLAAVFPTTSPTGIPGAAFWVRDRGYGLHSVQRQFRQHVRRGARHCEVRPIDWETLREHGMQCNMDTMRRRGVKSSPTLTSEGWSRICGEGSRVPGLEAFGCFAGTRLVAYLVAWTRGELCAGLVMHRSDAGEEVRAAHLLFYEFTHAILQREGITGVSMGRVMLPTQDSLEQFKRHAGYTAEPLQVAVVVHPSARWLLVNRWTRSLLRGTRRLAGDRLRFLDNLQVLDAAAVTDLTHPPAELR